MATKAYVLIDAEVGKVESILAKLRNTPGIQAADGVAGPHDIVVVLEATDPNEVGKLVLAQIHGTEGVKSTLTMMVVV